MIHLFKKVYVVSDRQINLNLDRVVISEENGVDVLHYTKNIFQGSLLAYAKNVDDLLAKNGSWDDIFNLIDECVSNSNQTFMIYCDDNAMMQLLSVWFKNLLPNSNKTSIESLIKGSLFKYNVFYKNRFATETSTLNFSSLYDMVENQTLSLSSSIRSKVGVEFLLATYLSSGDMKNELKNVLKVLIRKDLEKYLFEVKEIFFVHLLTRKFNQKLNFTKVYTYDNVTEVLEDQSNISKLFLSDRLWNYKYMSMPSSENRVINLENFTSEDIAVLNEFVDFATGCWEEEGVYTGPKSDANKMKFISIYSDFTDELLDEIIEIESEFEHAAGSFFSIDLESVNHYLITEILERKKLNDTDWIKQYSLE